MGPLFLLSCARSGSTLLRRALNAHPQLAAPPELHLLQLAQRLLWTQRITLEGALSEGPAYRRAIPATRAILDDIMDAYLRRVGGQTWVEKSVTSVNHLDVLEGVYPDAGVIIVYRHAADVVASGLRAIADRPEGYDFEPYLAADPHRPQALLRYWLHKTERLHEFASNQTLSPITTVRYEDLVRSPESTLAGLAEELGLAAFDGWAEQVWETPFEVGPGDATAYQRNGFSADSLGLGADLEWHGVSRNLVRKADRLLAALSYPELESEHR